MSSKSTFLVIGALVIIGAYFFISDSSSKRTENVALVSQRESHEMATNTPQPAAAQMMETGEVPQETAPSTPSTSGVKEFTMTSWMDKVDGKMAAHFSLKEINVKKGDRVRIKITNTAGNHDFNLDDFGIHKDTPLNQETVVEFTADKVGEFEFYCSKYNHRALGQRGTLRVTE